MHVAMLVDRTNTQRASGVERATDALVTGLREAGIRVTLLTTSRAGAGSNDRDLRVLDMGARYQLLRDFRPWAGIVGRELLELKPDIVHGQGLLHHGTAAVAWWGAPSVVTAHGNPVADARWQYPPATLPALTWLLRRAASRVIARAGVVIDVAPDWRANCPREPARWVHIPNPVDDAFYGSDPPAPASDVLFVGGTRRIKGLDVLLDAWPLVTARRPEARLRVWGMAADDPAPVSDRCRATSGCTIEGLVSGGQVATVLRGGGVAVVPSRFEVAPLAIAEAWATGIPVVATAVGGVSAYADDAALLVPAEEPASLATALLSALEGGPEVAALTAAGAQRAEAQRTSAVVDAHVALYSDLLERSRA